MTLQPGLTLHLSLPTDMRRSVLLACFLLPLVIACGGPTYDVLIKGGTVYDGSGQPGVRADVAIQGDTIAAIGDLPRARGRSTVDATGLAVAPGFINMLSWATESLIEDGRSQSDIRQGVTLEVMGEGMSMGPLSDTMKATLKGMQGDIKYDIGWTTLGEYLEFLEKKGSSTNVASFIGATTVRIHEVGFANRVPTSEELDRMRTLVRTAMEEGALGVGSSLIYPPAFFATTEELIELNRAAAPFGGMYISHMRSEANRLLEAVQELIRIAREAGVPAEIYHLKASGQSNWYKMDSVFAMVEAARAEGLKVTADMYTYPAGSTGLDATMPPWVQDGGTAAMLERLRDPAMRRRIAREMNTPTNAWENMLQLTGGTGDGILLVGFTLDSLKPLTGKTLADLARARGRSPAETAMELVYADASATGVSPSAVYFMMDTVNIVKQLARPWVSLGSDGASLAPEGGFLKSSTHPRAYGNFARFLGKYVRDGKVMPLEEAIRRLTRLPAENLKLRQRGALRGGFYADVVVFDPATIQDHATFAEPHQYSTGVQQVFVNGVQVLKDGEHTGALPGRVVRGPGWKGWD
ncbi:MAG TPA: D-aminoacylase [Gemmatimonadales bacterium]